jgi:hypothetical protein
VAAANSNKSVNDDSEEKTAVSGEPLNWSDDAELIVSTFARAAALGADPLVPGLRGRAMDKSRFEMTNYSIVANQSRAQKSTTVSLTSRLPSSSSSSSSSLVGDGDFSQIAMNSSRPTTFSAILYWTPQSFTVLTGRDTGDVACYGIASNLRIERTARPPSTDKSLFIDAYRFRCDERGFFSFQCDKKKMKSTNESECN